jgi:hypothetical protein
VINRSGLSRKLEEFNVCRTARSSQMREFIGMSLAQRARLRAVKQGSNSLALRAVRLMPRPFCACSLDIPSKSGIGRCFVAYYRAVMIREAACLNRSTN